MLTERRWYAIPVQSFTSNGTVDGKITVATTKPYKVKQKVRINAVGQDQLILEVKRVSSPTELYVGPCHGSIDNRTNISAYTTVGLASIEVDEQNRSNVPEQEIPRAVFEEEPTLAIRAKLVDWLGRCYTWDNPFPVGITDGSDQLAINPDGSINVVASIGGSQASTPSIVEVPVALAGTEYSFLLPSGVKRFYVKSRSGTPKLKVAYTSGQVANPTGNFYTVYPGNSFDREAISFSSSKTLYFSSSKPSEIIEIEYWL